MQHRPAFCAFFLFVLFSSQATTVDAASPPGRFEDRGTTVRDTVAKLEWLKTSSPTAGSLASAVVYCSGLGYRLPTLKELVSLLDYRTENPALDPVFSGVIQDRHWTSTQRSGDPTQHWFVAMQNGIRNISNSTTGGGGLDSYALCVRASPD